MEKQQRVQISDLIVCYKYLKSIAYYENLNLFLKKKVACFEAEFLSPRTDSFDSRNGPVDLIKGWRNREIGVHPLEKVLNILEVEDVSQSNFFQDLLNQIDYRLLPKNFSADVGPSSAASPPLFISNNKISKTYNVDGLNYFIDMPVELHVLEVLWSIVVGRLLEYDLSADCYGNRLSRNAAKTKFSFDSNGPDSSNKFELFCRYFEQYNNWRDSALDEASSIGKKNQSSAILSLDFASFFYSISVNWSDILETIEVREKDNFRRMLGIKLTKILRMVHEKYSEYISNHFSLTHKDFNVKSTIPIGLSSSSIISNWHMHKFDNWISTRLRPAYYGRYVDDLIFVFSKPDINRESKNTVGDFIDKYFSEKIGTSNNDRYFLKDYEKIEIQLSKVMLHHFQAGHSLAGLEVYKKELEKNSSVFRFLPDDEVDHDPEKFAYDILYAGSTNKFRSMVGLAENDTELSKYLSRQIIAHRLCEVPTDNLSLEKIRKFFKGLNGVKFYRLWEKVLAYSLIKDDQKFAIKFFSDTRNLIERIRFYSEGHPDQQEKIVEKIKLSLTELLDTALALGTALSSPTRRDELYSKLNNYIITKTSRTYKSGLSVDFRTANMFRHNLVAWPLVNYCDYDEDLTNNLSHLKGEQLSLSRLKLDLSPRFLHFDEWQTFEFLKRMQGKNPESNLVDFFEDSQKEYKLTFNGKDLPVSVVKKKSVDKVKISYTKVGSENRNKIKVGIANIKISAKDIEAAFRADRRPNISQERQSELFHILNSAEREESDLLILPEVSIPIRWLPIMISHSRRHQIGLIFGLEHWVSGGRAFNFLVEVLPFKINDSYNSCALVIRNKNHYAPREKTLLKQVGIIPGEPKPKNHVYYLHNWNGVSLASYNCFELADIHHRSLFKSDLDLLAACVWNKDTNYYQNILEASVRDLFCFVLQANTSQYGGSCVLQPERTDRLNIIKVKGGENSCILTATLDLKTLRKAQHDSVRHEGERYKPTPPGFDHARVLKR